MDVKQQPQKKRSTSLRLKDFLALYGVPTSFEILDNIEEIDCKDGITRRRLKVHFLNQFGAGELTLFLSKSLTQDEKGFLKTYRSGKLSVIIDLDESGKFTDRRTIFEQKENADSKVRKVSFSSMDDEDDEDVEVPSKADAFGG